MYNDWTGGGEKPYQTLKSLHGGWAKIGKTTLRFPCAAAKTGSIRIEGISDYTLGIVH